MELLGVGCILISFITLIYGLMSRNGHRQYDPIDGPQYGGMSIRPPSTRQTQTHVQSPSGQGYHYQGGRGASILFGLYYQH